MKIETDTTIYRNALLNIIYTITNMIFPIITFSYVSRIIFVEKIGLINFFSNISNFVIMLSSLGISTYGIRAVARKRGNQTELTKVTQELFLINLFATIFIVLVFIIIASHVPKLRNNNELVLMNCIMIILAPFAMNWLFSGLECYSYITKRSLIIKLISIVLILLCIRKPEDYLIYAYIIIISSIVTYICNFLFSRKFISFKPIRWDFRIHFKPMLYLFASILAINIYTHLDTVMLGFISGDKEVGLYTVAVYVKTALLALINSISAVILPRISFYYATNKEESISIIIEKSATIIFMFSLPLVLFFIIEAYDCILILGGEGYLEAVPCMQIIMPVLLLSGLSNVIGNQILIPMGKEVYFMRAVMSGAMIDILINLLLMPSFGSIGAAIGTLVAEFIQMSIQLIYSKRCRVIKIDIISLIKILISGVIAFTCTFILKNAALLSPGVKSLVVSFLTFIILFIATLIFTKEKEMLEMINLVKNNFKLLG